MLFPFVLVCLLFQKRPDPQGIGSSVYEDRNQFASLRYYFARQWNPPSFLMPSAVLAMFGVFVISSSQIPGRGKVPEILCGYTGTANFVVAAIMEAAVCQYFGPGSFSAKYGVHVIHVNPPISRKMVSINIILINLTRKAHVPPKENL